MLKVLNKTSLFQASRRVRHSVLTRFITSLNFDSDEEILTNGLENVKMIGFNLPDTKNVLTETALQDFRDSIINFEEDDNYSTCVLHGSGGNFCTGIEQTEKGIKLSQDILQILHKLKKPLIAALNGYTTNYGFYLALMCDVRVIEMGGRVGPNDSAGRIEIPDFIRERLVFNVGPSRAMQILCTRQAWHDKEMFDSNFVVRIVEPGCALGQALVYAKSMSFNSSLESLIEEKSKILSYLPSKS